MASMQACKFSCDPNPNQPASSGVCKPLVSMQLPKITKSAPKAVWRAHDRLPAVVFHGRCIELSDDAWRTAGLYLRLRSFGQQWMDVSRALILSPAIVSSRASFIAGNACAVYVLSTHFVSLSCLLKQSRSHAQLIYVGDEPGWASGKHWIWMLKAVEVLAVTRNKISWAASIKEMTAMGRQILCNRGCAAVGRT